MSEIDKLKKANRIEDVIEESGFPLVDQGGGYWNGDTPGGAGIAVHVGRQRYYWDRLDESGDVIEWLKNRFGWDLKKALNYLRTRADTPEADRARARVRAVEAARLAAAQKAAEAVEADPDPEESPPTEDLQDEAPGEGWRAWHGNDRRVIAAFRLGHDYPGGLARMLDRAEAGVSIYSEFEAWLRKIFLPLVGAFGLDVCSHCFRELRDTWEGAGAYLAIDLGDDYELVPLDEGSSLFCSECVSKYGRWLRAVRELRPVLIELEKRFEQQARERIEAAILEELRLRMDLEKPPREHESLLSWVSYTIGDPPGGRRKWPVSVEDVLIDLVRSGQVIQEGWEDPEVPDGGEVSSCYRLPADE